MQVVVIGGGAAGFFAALSVREHHPQASVLLLEKSDKVLAKVKVSGGGRCNVTHACMEPKKLAKNYPRGERFLREAFKQWCVKETIAWFEARGVRLKTEPDGRMFPGTDSSQTIIDALLNEAVRTRVEVALRSPVEALVPMDGKWQVVSRNGSMLADRVIIASGGSPKLEGLRWLEKLGHSIIPPVPSLFTFNLPEERITALMGVVANARVRLEGMDLDTQGPLLITHWGLSGPAILRLSAWGARALHNAGHVFRVRINWLGGVNEEAARTSFEEERHASPKRSVKNSQAFTLPGRLWEYLIERAGLDAAKPLGDIGKHDLNRTLSILTNDAYDVRGKTTFKEEFVTAGGVSLDDVDPATMASKRASGLYFAGEVLDIDGITGGFNFQAAWTTGWIAGKGC